MSNNIKVFISYSHDDREKATQIAESLRSVGIDAWFDKWEILPGDSLIKKIFSEGLAKADVFAILLSENSIDSKWVNQELDVAFLNRIEGLVRIIPIKLDAVNVPDHLRTISWLDMSENFEEKLRELQMAIFEVRKKPSLGEQPTFTDNAFEPISGLSRLATALGLLFVNTGNHETGNELSLKSAEIANELGFTPVETDDAIDELENMGLVKTQNYLGTAPYSHGIVEPTYALFLHFDEYIENYNPEEDIKSVVSLIAAEGQVNGEKIKESTDLSPLRINRAVSYLEDYGIIKVYHEIGSAPYDFGFILSTGRTRRYVEENCR
jgi:hypothetical protein